MDALGGRLMIYLFQLTSVGLIKATNLHVVVSPTKECQLDFRLSIKALQSVAHMIENERTPALQKEKEIQWQHYNYPPLLRIVHFVPEEIPQDHKLVVMSLYALHLASLPLCLLNFIDNCVEGGLGILYSLLFAFIFIPLLLYIFYRGMTGVCKRESSLKMYLILQPIVVALEIIAAIADFLGFNGFVKVSQMFKDGDGGAGALGLIVALIFLAMALYSSFIYVKVMLQRKALKGN